MASSSEASVAEWKRELIADLQEKFEEYPVVGVMDISGIPARQFQGIRDLLRGKAEIKVSRKVLLRLALERAGEEKPALKDLTEYLEGPCALVFTKMNPFKLWKLLNENRTYAPAKVGMGASEDIVIPEGETDFPPGPIVGELQQAGVNARIQAGKVVVLEDSKVVKEGEPFSEEVVGVLSRFDINPREIGFDLRAAYEDGIVFSGDTLVVDEDETREDIQNAYIESFGLSIEINFPTAQNAGMIVGRAHTMAYNLAVNGTIFTADTARVFVNKANSEMFGLASALASMNSEAVGEELSSLLSTQEVAREKEEKEKPKEEAEEKVEEEKEEKEKEEEPTAGLGGLF